MSDEEHQRLSANAQAAIAMFADVEGKKLAFDEESVGVVDGFITEKRDVFDGPIRNRLVSVLGAFLGECVRKNFGGEWCIINQELAIGFDEKNAVFPFSKVRKQFENGTEDSILSFYQLIPIMFSGTV